MKNKDSLPFEKKSHFNDSRDSYVDKDGNYVYTQWVRRDNGKWERVIVDILPLSAENKEVIIMLDQFDHDADLQDRYAEENDDYSLRNQQKKNDSDGYGVEEAFDEDPLNNIVDSTADIFSQVFPDEEMIDPKILEMGRFVRSELTEEQQNLFFAHMGEEKFLEDIRREEEIITGKKVTKQAVHRRWDKIMNKTCKHFNVERPKQEHKKKDDR